MVPGVRDTGDLSRSQDRRITIQIEAKLKAARVAGLREAAEIAEEMVNDRHDTYDLGILCVVDEIRAKADAVEKGTE